MTNQEGYYLIANPRTGLVERKSHKPAKLWESHLVSLRVDKAVWKTYKSGDLISIANLPEPYMSKWLNAIK